MPSRLGVFQMRRSGQSPGTIFRNAFLATFIIFLAIYPVLLGGGVRLFPDDGASHRLALLDSRPSTRGVILATYKPA